MNENDKDKLIKITIEVLNHTTFNPIVMKSLDVIGHIIKKGKHYSDIKIKCLVTQMFHIFLYIY